MEAFGELFGFAFMAHAIGHSDRKGRVERPFSYIENNFLAGRTFADWADLNVQARAWCKEVANAKPKRILGMSPQAAYATEKAHLLALPAYIPPVTEIHYRVVDCYGFVHLDTNRYSVPERWVGKEGGGAQTPRAGLGLCRSEAGRRASAPDRTAPGRAAGQGASSPARAPPPPGRTFPPGAGAQRASIPASMPYVVALKKRAPGRGVGKLRRLLELKRTYPAEPFLAAIEQALQYGLFDLARLERLILERVAGDFFDLDGEL